MKKVIEVRDLGKHYSLGVSANSADTLLGSFVDAVSAPIRNYKRIRRLGASKHDGKESFWALKDVSFDAYEGDVLAIIGKNGAGKSTMLKILSRITRPTAGYIKLSGRVAALLEVGTGFHPELTGRENVFMNGTILGMSNREVRSKFDEIVEFSGVSRFIDTPVKFYSSGMKVRLGFAVAAHLDPEILIVDEVLSVGDSEFQKKAIGKMQKVTKGEGRTVLFVSHNLRAVSQLCNRAILLKDGVLAADGEVGEIIQQYLRGAQSLSDAGFFEFNEYVDNIELQVTSVALRNSAGEIKGHFTSNEITLVEVSFVVREAVTGARIGVHLENENGVLVFASTNSNVMPMEMVPGKYVTVCEIPISILSDGQYYVSVFSGIPGQRVLLSPTKVLSLSITQLSIVGSRFTEKFSSIIVPKLDWTFAPK